MANLNAYKRLIFRGPRMDLSSRQTGNLVEWLLGLRIAFPVDNNHANEAQPLRSREEYGYCQIILGVTIFLPLTTKALTWKNLVHCLC